MIEPVGEARNDYLIFAELAAPPRLRRALAADASAAWWSWRSRAPASRYEELAASPDGFELPSRRQRYRKYETGELRADGTPGFQHAHRPLRDRVRVVPRHGYEPLPVYTEPTRGAARRARAGAEATRSCSPPAPAPVGLPLPAPQHPLAPRRCTLATRPPPRGRRRRPRHRRRRRRGRRHASAAGCPSGRASTRTSCAAPSRRTWAAVAHSARPPGATRTSTSSPTPRNFDPISGFPVYKALLCDVAPRRRGARPDAGSPLVEVPPTRS